MDTTQVEAVPEHAPLQPPKVAGAVTAAESVTAAPAGNEALHRSPQSIPAGVEVTVPSALPATTSGCVCARTGAAMARSRPATERTPALSGVVMVGPPVDVGRAAAPRYAIASRATGPRAAATRGHFLGVRPRPGGSRTGPARRAASAAPVSLARVAPLSYSPGMPDDKKARPFDAACRDCNAPIVWARSTRK